MRLLVLTVAAIAISATPAIAGKKGQKGQKDPGERRVCKSFDEPGSRTRSLSVCKTKAEWDLEEQTRQDELADLQRKDGGRGQSRDGTPLPGQGDIDRATQGPR